MCAYHSSVRPFLALGTYLFLTQYGYLAGRIIAQEGAQISVQYGPEKYLGLVSTSQIQPHRLNERLTLHVDLKAGKKIGSGYLQPGTRLDLAHPGSGVFGTIQAEAEGISEYPLTLHDESHQYLLIQVNTLIQVMLNNYLDGHEFEPEQIHQLVMMINAVLYIDDYPPIPSPLIQMALMNFLTDLTGLSEQTWLRSPLNYILDILHIDSICYQNHALGLLPSYDASIQFS